MLLCDVDIMNPAGVAIAGLRNVEIQKACDQMMGWLEQGLSVNVRVDGNTSPLVETAAAQAERERDDAEIISFVSLDIPY